MSIHCNTVSNYLKELARYGLDHDRLNDLNKIGLYYQKLRDLCESGENKDLYPDEIELKKLNREFENNNYTPVNRILAATKSQAEAYFLKLNGAADLIDLFNNLARESDDQIGPRDINDLDIKLKQIAENLRVGQVSGIVESGDGFCILIKLPPEKKILLDTWLDRKIENQAENAEILLFDNWNKITARDFDLNLLKARNALDT